MPARHMGVCHRQQHATSTAIEAVLRRESVLASHTCTSSAAPPCPAISSRQGAARSSRARGRGAQVAWVSWAQLWLTAGDDGTLRCWSAADGRQRPATAGCARGTWRRARRSRATRATRTACARWATCPTRRDLPAVGAQPWPGVLRRHACIGLPPCMPAGVVGGSLRTGRRQRGDHASLCPAHAVIASPCTAACSVPSAARLAAARRPGCREAPDEAARADAAGACTACLGQQARIVGGAAGDVCERRLGPHTTPVVRAARPPGLRAVAPRALGRLGRARRRRRRPGALSRRSNGQCNGRV